MAKNTPAPEEEKLQTTRPASIAEIPDYLKDVTTVPRGLDQVDATKMTMPRIAICQDGTPHRKKTNAAYIEGLEEGDIFNTLSRRIYGRSISIIPLWFYNSRIFFKDIDQGGGILCQAPDGKSCQLNNGGHCLHNVWGVNGEPPECTELYNFPCLVLLPNEPAEFAVLSLKSTMIRAAKDLNSLARQRKRDIFAGVYLVSSVPDNKKGKDFFNIMIVNNGWADMKQFKYAEATYNDMIPKIQSGEVTFDTTGMDAEKSDEQFASRDAENTEL
jgi:hypothetical protein